MTKKQLELATRLFEDVDMENGEDAMFVANILLENRELSFDESFRLKSIYDREIGYGIES